MNNNIPTPSATRPLTDAARPLGITRRRFVASAGAAALSFTVLQPARVGGTDANTRLSIGLIGCGKRGQWITNHFLKHGGYQLAAVADYFPDQTQTAGDKFGVPADMRFAGLNGYKKLLEQKLDAVVIETPPYFHPQQAADAVDAGKHVFLAKPVAVDVPGCQIIADAGRRATAKKLCFLVDFQTRAHASYQEAVQRVQNGMIDRIISAEANYLCGPTWSKMDELLRADPQNPEVRLRAWGVDRKLSGDVITEQNIHALDVATWFLDAHPIRAYGTGGRARNFVGDCWDHFAVIFTFPMDVLVSFASKQVGAGIDDIMCRVYGFKGFADTHYFGKVMVRATDDLFNGGEMTNLYSEGAVNNIATFHRSILGGDFSNPTVAPSVRSNLTTILGRTAAYRRAEVTWEQMMKTNEQWEVSLKGLKA